MCYWSVLPVSNRPSCSPGEEDGSRETGESDMDGHNEKTRNPTIGPEDWDGPSKPTNYVDNPLIGGGPA